ncbi:hypothetical protein GPICK_04935 [Geobacter pickeringii]|uniref:Bacterial sugar transferase domain-containing protein n=1 Tax=Geobacter pickeringii TaxID=345632 RepID=A0A0B5BEB5_9BACT|nr:hypothetical protein GPICK_04935 [Geobacter pickeringii]
MILANLLKGFDLLVFVGSFMTAAAMVAWPIPELSVEEFFAMRVKVQNAIGFAGFMAVWSLVFKGFDIYSSKRLATRDSEVLDVLKAVSVGSAVIYLLGVLFNISLITIPFAFAFWSASAAATVASRLLMRSLLERLRVRGRNLRHVVIVGTNRRAVAFARKIEGEPELGYRIIGFVDGGDWPRSSEFRDSGYPLVADFRELPGFLRSTVVDEVAIFLPLKSLYQQGSLVVSQCEEQGIIVRIPPDLFSLKVAHATTEELQSDPVITFATGAMEGWPIVAKRFLDLLASTALLLVLAPLLALVAATIKITSPGPVFFAQERLGHNKRRFRMYKFRTMVADAERRQACLEHLNEAGGPVFKIRNDPRITPLGKFLRKTSIDELPQLFNVLRGDISLVGPRPLPVRDYEGFDQDWHRRRFSVRPGITCLWQISGRSNISFDRWMELDMEYIDRWSLWLDIKILVKTIPAVLRGVGAA